MKKNLLKLKRGFTIIEVSLVISIAGLIFLMVFVALPGLRATQRDTQRREDMIAFIEAVKKYQTNNRGSLPTDTPKSTEPAISVNLGDSNGWGGFYEKYLGEKFVDPDGESYKLVVMECNQDTNGRTCENGELNGSNLYDKSFAGNNYQMRVVVKGKCDGDKAVKAANPRTLAVIYKLQGAGVYCTNT